MHTRTLLTATLLTVALAATGCGLLETNDDEMETLRVEIIQLREDFMDLEAEVSLLARMPATTTTNASSSATTTAASATGAATTTRAPSSAAAPAEEDQAPAPTVPVGLNEEAILTATYEWGPSDPALILQELLGVTADGWYGNGTRAAHAAELEARGLSTDGVPSPPTTAAPETTEARPRRPRLRRRPRRPRRLPLRRQLLRRRPQRLQSRRPPQLPADCGRPHRRTAASQTGRRPGVAQDPMMLCSGP